MSTQEAKRVKEAMVISRNREKVFAKMEEARIAKGYGEECITRITREDLQYDFGDEVWTWYFPHHIRGMIAHVVYLDKDCEKLDDWDRIRCYARSCAGAHRGDVTLF